MTTIAGIEIKDFILNENETYQMAANRYGVSVASIGRLIVACKKEGIQYIKKEKSKPQASVIEQKKVEFKFIINSDTAKAIMINETKPTIKTYSYNTDEYNFILDIAKEYHTNADALSKLEKLFEVEIKFVEQKGDGWEITKNDIKVNEISIGHDTIGAIISKSTDVNNVVSKFLSNLADNPDKRVITHIGLFLRHNYMELNEDGNIIAYKAVRNDYKDIFSGMIDNSIGKTIKMKRSLVNDNPREICSHGLHVGSREYAVNFGKGKNKSRLVKVLVNPKDVVSVPNDYDGQKCRVCEYTVVDEEFII